MPTIYKCNQCGAMDKDSQSYTAPPSSLICYNPRCRAGKDVKTYMEQLELRLGMFPLNEAGQFPWEAAGI